MAAPLYAADWKIFIQKLENDMRVLKNDEFAAVSMGVYDPLSGLDDEYPMQQQSNIDDILLAENSSGNSEGQGSTPEDSVTPSSSGSSWAQFARDAINTTKNTVNSAIATATATLGIRG